MKTELEFKGGCGDVGRGSAGGAGGECECCWCKGGARVVHGWCKSGAKVVRGRCAGGEVSSFIGVNFHYLAVAENKT